MKTIDLGVTAKDIVTGFQGVVTAHVNYLTGCDQYALAPGLDKDGKIMDSIYFDVNRLEVVKDKAKVSVETSAAKGGPNLDAPRR